MFQGIRTSIAKTMYFFCFIIYQCCFWSGPPAPPPPLDPPMNKTCKITQYAMSSQLCRSSCIRPEPLCEDPESFADEGERIQIPLNAGKHQNASETPFKWRFAGGPMMAQQH